jgi:hypothetical protein
VPNPKIIDLAGRFMEIRAQHAAGDSGDEPPYDGGMEARVAKLEASMSHIEGDIRDIKTDMRDFRKDLYGLRDSAQRDFRTLFGALIVVALGLASIMAKGFGWL